MVPHFDLQVGGTWLIDRAWKATKKKDNERNNNLPELSHASDWFISDSVREMGEIRYGFVLSTSLHPYLVQLKIHRAGTCHIHLSCEKANATIVASFGVHITCYKVSV